MGGARVWLGITVEIVVSMELSVGGTQQDGYL